MEPIRDKTKHRFSGQLLIVIDGRRANHCLALRLKLSSNTLAVTPDGHEHLPEKQWSESISKNQSFSETALNGRRNKTSADTTDDLNLPTANWWSHAV